MKRAAAVSAGIILVVSTVLVVLNLSCSDHGATALLNRTPHPPAWSIYAPRSQSSSAPAATATEVSPAPAPLAAPPADIRGPVPLWGNGGAITLTFDDYGTDERVNAILDVLAQYHVRAIFFPIGTWANAHPDLIARMLRDGHLVGNHTYDHAYLPRLSPDQIRDEIVRGYQSTLFRPPYGAYNPLVASIAAQLGYQMVLWSIDTRDWAGASASSMVATVLGQARPGAIVLMHMHGAHTLEALPEMIQRLQAAGYVLSTAAAMPAATVTAAPSTPSPSTPVTITPTPLVSVTPTLRPPSPTATAPPSPSATRTQPDARVTPGATETPALLDQPTATN